MAFTLPELRDELEALGYGGIPDQVIISSLSELELQNRSHGFEVTAKNRSPRRLHGSPVRGDREFAKTRRSTVNRGGLGSVCFTEDFAVEVDKMRVMLQSMGGMEGKLFSSGPGLKTSGKRMGLLADEHKQYVDGLYDQWRQVGRALSFKRIESVELNAGNSENSCETGSLVRIPSTETDHHGKVNESIDEIQLLPSADFASSRKVDALNDSGSCYSQESRDDHGLMQHEKMDVEPLIPSVKDRDYEGDSATDSNGAKEKEIDVTASKGQISTYIEETGKSELFFIEDSCTISPEISRLQCDMLYPGNLIDVSDFPEKRFSADALAADHEHQENPSPSPPSSPRDPKTVLDKVSALCDKQFVAAFEKSLNELDAQATIDQETFANVNQKIRETTEIPSISIQPSEPAETENPLDLSVPVLRPPDRRGGGHASPLNDRSNTHNAENAVLQKPRTKAVFRITEFNSVVTQKPNSSFTVQRSRSFRDARCEKTEHHLSDITEDRLDSDTSLDFTSPPPSARNTRSEKVLRHSLSEKYSPRTALENKFASDASHLDIGSLGLSPIKVKEPASPYKLSTRHRHCGGNGHSEHRQGTCSVCPPASVRKSAESSPRGIVTTAKCPYSKGVSCELDASPKQRFSTRKEPEKSPKPKVPPRKDPEASPKQKFPIRKGSGPSGIYTPLLDHKDDINSSVLLKTSRLSTSMDFNSDNSSRYTYRRAPNLRSSTDSSVSSGTDLTTTSQDSKSNSGSSPYTRSSSSTSFFGSRAGKPKDPLTPGGPPRRGGKVDRVARALEDMRPTSETPPFVVPTSINNYDRLKSRKAGC